MSLTLLQGAIEEGLIYGIVALGLFVSYQILSIADMTTDGSFVLGGAVSAVCTMAGYPILGLMLGFVAGGLAGFVTGKLQTVLEIPSIVAGIITMTGLYTVNLFVQGGPNLFFPSHETVFSKAEKIVGENYGVLIVLLVLVGLVITLLHSFFKTRLGLSIRATGDNAEMAKASSINPGATVVVGLCLSNGLMAMAGGLLAQRNIQNDISGAVDVVVIGLAGLILGRVILKNEGILLGLLSAVLGSVVYRILFTVALRYTPDPGYLKIVSAVLIGVVLSYPTLWKNYQFTRAKRKAGEQHAHTK